MTMEPTKVDYRFRKGRHIVTDGESNLIFMDMNWRRLVRNADRLIGLVLNPRGPHPNSPPDIVA